MRGFAVTPPARGAFADLDRKVSMTAWPGPPILDQVREIQIKLNTYVGDEGLHGEIRLPDGVVATRPAPDAAALRALHMDVLLTCLSDKVAQAWRSYDRKRDAGEYLDGLHRLEDAIEVDAINLRDDALLRELMRPRAAVTGKGVAKDAQPLPGPIHVPHRTFTESPPLAWRTLRSKVLSEACWGSAEAIGVMQALLKAQGRITPAGIAAALARLIAVAPRDPWDGEHARLLDTAALLIAVAWSNHPVEADPERYFHTQQLRRFIDRLVLAWSQRIAPRSAPHSVLTGPHGDGKGAALPAAAADAGGVASVMARLAEYVHVAGDPRAPGTPQDLLRPLFLSLLARVHKAGFPSPRQLQSDRDQAEAAQGGGAPAAGSATQAAALAAPVAAGLASAGLVPARPAPVARSDASAPKDKSAPA